MNENTQDIEITEIVEMSMKNVMAKYLFKPTDSITFRLMEREIAKELITYDMDFLDLDYEISVDQVDGDVVVSTEIFGVGKNGSLKRVATYLDCPVINPLGNFEESSDYVIDTERLAERLAEKIKTMTSINVTNKAFDDAMDIVK